MLSFFQRLYCRYYNLMFVISPVTLFKLPKEEKRNERFRSELKFLMKIVTARRTNGFHSSGQFFFPQTAGLHYFNHYFKS